MTLTQINPAKSNTVKQPLVSLTLDSKNVIFELSENWDNTAKQGNANPSAYANNILGHRLSEFISSDTTTMYIETALKLVRLKKKTLYKPYRCDSPTHKVFMEMEIILLENNSVKINHYLLKEEPFECPLFLKDISKSKGAETFILRCSLCNRLRATHQKEWLTPDNFNAQEESPLLVIHTVCEDCKNKPWLIRH